MSLTNLFYGGCERMLNDDAPLFSKPRKRSMPTPENFNASLFFTPVTWIVLLFAREASRRKRCFLIVLRVFQDIFAPHSAHIVTRNANGRKVKSTRIAHDTRTMRNFILFSVSDGIWCYERNEVVSSIAAIYTFARGNCKASLVNELISINGISVYRLVILTMCYEHCMASRV